MRLSDPPVRSHTSQSTSVMPGISVLAFLVCQSPSLVAPTSPVTHGPVLGGATDSSMVIWVRLAGPLPTRVVFHPQADPTTLRATAWQVPELQNDWTLRFHLDGLDPETSYEWVLETGPPFPWLSGTRTFRTAPDSAQRRTFRFAVFADAAFADNPARAYRSAALDDPAFVLQIGDLDHRNPAEQGAAPDIKAWRVMHRQHLGDWQAGRALVDDLVSHVPLYHIWDDHDYGANNSDRTAPWKDLAKRAFREYFPLPPLPAPDQGLWYSFRYAQAEFFVLDLRSQRDPNDDPDGPGKSMLNGAGLPGGQDAWLLEGLRRSTARWKFLVSSSCWNPRGKQVDSWAEFRWEQQAILAFLKKHDIRGVIVVSADIHSGGAIDDGTNSVLPEISVPTTNVPRSPHGCTGGPCGTWSVGVHEVGEPAGYALITVEFDSVSRTDSVLLEAKAADGTTRLSWRVR